MGVPTAAVDTVARVVGGRSRVVDMPWIESVAWRVTDLVPAAALVGSQSPLPIDLLCAARSRADRLAEHLPAAARLLSMYQHHSQNLLRLDSDTWTEALPVASSLLAVHRLQL